MSSVTTKPLSNADLLELRNAIQTLDQGRELTVDGKSTRRPYDLDQKARFVFARALLLIKPAIAAWEEANKALFESFEPASVTVGDQVERRIAPHRSAEYQAAAAALLAEPASVTLPRMPVASLKIGSGPKENPIPWSIVAALAPLIEPCEELGTLAAEPAGEEA